MVSKFIPKKGRLLNKAVFLDRDGVLNEPIIIAGKPFPPTSLAEMVIDEFAVAATNLFSEKGFMNIVVSNQPDVARRLISRDVVEELNDYLFSNLTLDHIEVCYHDDNDNCSCRKPKAGMLLSTSRKFNIDLSQSFMIGDRWRDIDAGKAAGCKTIFIDRHYSELKPDKPTFVASSLYDAAEQLLGTLNDKF